MSLTAISTALTKEYNKEMKHEYFHQENWQLIEGVEEITI